MDQKEAMRPPRKFWRRLGLAALNLLAPGLGLLRLGRKRLATGFLLAPLALLATLLLTWGVLSEISAPTYLAVTFGALALAAALYITSAVLTFRISKERIRPLRWWQTWPTLVIIWLILSTPTLLFDQQLQSLARYRPFWMPAESMMPGLRVGDNIVADMSNRRAPQRGEIVMIDRRSEMYIKRVVALSGDRFEMRDGVPHLNGRRVDQRPGPKMDIATQGQLFLERLPGERGTHRVMDTGTTEYDATKALVIPPGYVFVLGDNRDNSADSRVPRVLGGLELVRIDDVRGRAVFTTYDKNYRWLGRRLD